MVLNALPVMVVALLVASPKIWTVTRVFIAEMVSGGGE